MTHPTAHLNCKLGDLLAQPALALVVTQHGLQGMLQTSTHMRITLALSQNLDEYCAKHRVKKRSQVETVMRAFLAARDQPTP